MLRQNSTRTTGWSTCVTRCGSARPSPTPPKTHTTFVEISPHPLLTHGIGETLASVSSRDQFAVTAAMKRGDDETLSVHEQLATIGVTGDTGGRRRAEIPASPWLHASYWVEKKPAGQRLTNVHPLLGAHVELPSGHEHVWQTDVGVETLPWLADHTIHGRAAISAAGFAEMALAAAAQALGASAVSKLDIERPLILDAQTRITTQLSVSAGVNRVEIQARSAGGNWTRHAVADINQSGAPRRPASRPGRAARSCCPTTSPITPSSASTRCCSTRRCSSSLLPSRPSRRRVLPSGFGGDDPGVRPDPRPGPQPCRAGAGAG